MGIDLEKGLLNNAAHDFSSRVYSRIPGSNMEFAGAEIPYWRDVMRLAKKGQKRFGYYRLLGFDIGITPTGPVLVEINPSHDNIGLEQATGPLLAKTKIRKAFAEYGLFCNQRDIYRRSKPLFLVHISIFRGLIYNGGGLWSILRFRW